MVLAKIDEDLKSALLAGEKERVMVLRTIKSALQYETLNLGLQDSGLSDEQAFRVLSKEAKKRQESADLYEKGGHSERAKEESAEKEVIEAYLPKQLDEAQVQALVDEEIAKLPEATIKDMGKIVGAVMARSAGQTAGATVAGLTKQRLENR